MARIPLHHLVRIRSSDDLTFMRGGLMDEALVNANQLENSVQSTATALLNTTLPFSVDPILWRFQVPAWWRKRDGDTKRNYRRLAAAYTRGTSIEISAGGLLEVVSSNEQWRRLARNVIEYQLSRLLSVPTQLDLLAPGPPRQLRPSRLIAPAVVAYSRTEDRVNRVLTDASSSFADGGVAAQLIVPVERLIDAAERRRVLQSLPRDGVTSYFLWFPDVSEERLLTDHEVIAAILRTLTRLTDRGVPVGHLYGNYTIAALHDVGISAIAHHLGWVDKGDPAQEQDFMLRSCRTYVPGVRHSVRFEEANNLGRPLSKDEFVQLYCECTFCLGALEAGQSPLDLLLEEQTIVLSNGRERRIPTGRAVTANTWHYLLSRRLEVQQFSASPAAEVIGRHIARADDLAGRRSSSRLGDLAAQLQSA
jgi:hypothetical protein